MPYIFYNCFIFIIFVTAIGLSIYFGVILRRASCKISKQKINFLSTYLTPDNCVHIKITTKEGYTFYLAIFLDYDKSDREDVQSTLNYYYKDEKMNSYFGDLLYTQGILNKLLNNGDYKV